MSRTVRRLHPFVTEGRASAFAHRGDSARHPPGNRASAFAAAIDLGFDHLESDAHLTSDGEVVLFHDDRLDDETELDGPIGDVAWPDLASTRYVVDGEPIDEGPMRFADALAQWPDVFWNIDAKHDDVVDPLIDVIRHHDAARRVLLTSFSFRRLRRIRRTVGTSIATGHSRAELATVRVLAWLRLPLYTPGDAVQLPERRRGIRLVDERLIEACRRAGTAVHVFTINDADDMRRLVELGVDGLMTDDPVQLRRVLVDAGRW